MIFQDRVTGILDAHLASVSIQLAQASKLDRRGRDAVRAAHRADRALRHERAAAAPAGRGSGAVLVGGGADAARRDRDARCGSAARGGGRREPRSASCPTTWPTRSPPVRSSSGRPRWSRSWSRTPSTPRRRASPSPSSTGGKRLIRVEDDGIGMSPRTPGCAWSATPPARLPPPPTWRPSPRLGFRGEALPSIASVSRFTPAHPHPRRRGRHRDPGHRRPGRAAARRRRARGHRGHGRGPVLQPAGAAEVPEVRRRRGRARLEDRDAAGAVPPAGRLHPDQRRPPAAALPAGPIAGRSPVPDLRGSAGPGGGEPAGARRARSPAWSRRWPTRGRRAARSTSSSTAASSATRPSPTRSSTPTSRRRSRSGVPEVHLFLEVPLDRVDVNVHPTKAEVRFADQSLVHELVRRGLIEALGAATMPGLPPAALTSMAVRADRAAARMAGWHVRHGRPAGQAGGGWLVRRRRRRAGAGRGDPAGRRGRRHRPGPAARAARAVPRHLHPRGRRRRHRHRRPARRPRAGALRAHPRATARRPRSRASGCWCRW